MCWRLLNTLPVGKLAIAHHEKVTHNKNPKGNMESIKSASKPQTEFKFQEGEKVLCFHGPLLYQAKIMNTTVKDGQNRYLIHYMGWNEDWDEWVPENHLLKNDDEGLAKQKELLLQADWNNLNNNEKKFVKEASAPATKSARRSKTARSSRRIDEDEEIQLRWCLCGLHLKGFLMKCYQCDDSYHGSCVGVTEAKRRELETKGLHWFCPCCVQREFPIAHSAKLIKVVSSINKEFRPVSVDPVAQLNPESICEAELSKLALEIKTAQATLVKTERAAQEDGGILLARAIASDLLRQRMKEFQSEESTLSLKKEISLDHKNRLQKQLTELTNQKNQLERELEKLKETPAKKKTKQQTSCSDSSAVSMEIQEKEASLYEVKAKLLVFVEEDKDLMDRIEGLEKQLVDNAVILSPMRAELDSLKDGSAAAAGSAVESKLKALKKDQRSRIREFSRLEKKLFQLSSGHVLDELRRKEEEWINALGASDEDD